MIQLTRINGTELLVNEQFIEIAEQAPDTVVTMQNGHRYLVKETLEEIIDKSVQYSRECFPDSVK
ncbi:MAG: flagellar FlbD family protein [Oscillospiraceae bacterium]|nr:flagellar FlbD family protein [Oscillospiraceae bacterium]MDE7303507.1 flagellar FlbD family protein [Oscillospiraceae bacterium]